MTRGRSRQGGFSILEVLVVVAIIGIIAAVAVPALRYAMLYAKATSIVSDFTVFRTALVEFHNDSGRLPGETGPGVAPPELEPYLGSRLEWSSTDFQLDWENWRAEDGTPVQPETGIAYGLTVRTADEGLVSLLRAAYEGEARHLPGYGYTFVIAGLGGGAGSGAPPPEPQPTPDSGDQPTPVPEPTPPENGGGALGPFGTLAALALLWGAARLREAA